MQAILNIGNRRGKVSGETLNKENHPILILDTEVILHQIDFIVEDSSINNVVILYTVLNEVRRKNLQAYRKIVALCNQSEKISSSDNDLDSQVNNEIRSSSTNFSVFPNEFFRYTFVQRIKGETSSERNERAIQASCIWYTKHVEENCDKSAIVLLVTHSLDHKNRAIENGVKSMTIYEYVESVQSQFPYSAEKLAAMTNEIADEMESASIDDNDNTITGKIKKRKAYYPSYIEETIVNRNIKAKLFYQGKLRMKKGSYTKGIVTCTGSEDEINVVGILNLNRAIDGDIVALQIIEEPDTRVKMPCNNNEGNDDEGYYDEEINDVQTFIQENVDTDIFDTTVVDENSAPIKNAKYGKIVAILKRNKKEYCGTLKPEVLVNENDGSYIKRCRIFIPSDVRIPLINIKTRNSCLLDNKRLLVVIDSWDRYSKYPSGHWVSILGDIEDPNVENDVILRDHNVITREFSESVLKCLPPSDWKITDDILCNRLDLRCKLIFSIDPVGCKDIDDALSLEKLEDGNFMVGVHIADVTHFVKAGTAIDLEAASRCTTVYLVDRRTDMLPSLLTTDLCSLVSDRDRLTFSVFWEMNKDAEIVKHGFAKCVIRSRSALSYGEAQNIIDDPADVSQLALTLRQLNELAKILRQKRMRKGSLELASQEVQFEFDADCADPKNLIMYKIRETNHLVEEFMLLANISVATFILTKFPSFSVLRRHPPPKFEHLEILQNMLQKAGFHDFKYNNSKELATSLSKCKKKTDIIFEKLVRILTTRCMNSARYFCSGCAMDKQTYYHYGLSCELYTHFTSPIRRYADILVHRLLAAALMYEKLPESQINRTLLSEQCTLMNEKHMNAREASRAAIKLYTYFYFKKYGDVVEDAIVLQVTKKFVSVIVPKYGIEGVIFLSEDLFMYDTTKDCWISKTDRNISIIPFEHINVKIHTDSRNFRFHTVIEFVSMGTLTTP